LGIARLSGQRALMSEIRQALSEQAESLKAIE